MDRTLEIMKLLIDSLKNRTLNELSQKDVDYQEMKK